MISPSTSPLQLHLFLSTVYSIDQQLNNGQNGVSTCQRSSLVLSGTVSPADSLILPPLDINYLRPHRANRLIPTPFIAASRPDPDNNQQQTTRAIIRTTPTPSLQSKWRTPIQPPPPSSQRTPSRRQGRIWFSTSRSRRTHVQQAKAQPRRR